MLGVLLTIWLLLQLPVGLALGRFIACPQRTPKRRTAKRTEPHRPPATTQVRAA